ncbi:MAG: GbsR/MarR family transcriptional regulator [Pseudomonadota bacterium]
MRDAIEREFVLHFGEMGSRWGINRTVGQIFAVLFLSPEPLCADALCDRLGFSRSNVSMGLKELQAWNLVRLQHLPGDRRDYFSAPQDMWAIVRTLIAERKKREIDPTLTKLRELEFAADGADDHQSLRIRDLRELIETLTRFYEDMDRIETERLIAILKTGSRLSKLVAAGARVIPMNKRAENL